jgi:hypothetical protein
MLHREGEKLFSKKEKWCMIKSNVTQKGGE